MAYGFVNVGGGGGGLSQDGLEELRSAVTAAGTSAAEAKTTADTALAAANSAKSAADTAVITGYDRPKSAIAVSTANALKEIFEQTGSGGETGSEVTLAFYHIGPEPPENTKLLWIDTTAGGTGGLKYHTGSAWAAVPVAWG